MILSKHGDNYADRYLRQSPDHKIRRQRDGGELFGRREVPSLETAVDRACRIGKRARTEHHRRADRRDGKVQGRHQLRRCREVRKRGASRRHGARQGVRQIGAQGNAHHTSRRDVVLCDRQCGGDHHRPRTRSRAGKAGQRDGQVEGIRAQIQRSADAGLHSPSTRRRWASLTFNPRS